MIRLILILCVCICFGCASGKKEDTISVSGGGGSTSKPADTTVDASQITAQVVAQAKQEIKADAELVAHIAASATVAANATINAQGFGTYNSEYGLGAVITVVAKDLISFIIQCLVIWGLLRLVESKDQRSHEREMKRIEFGVPEGWSGGPVRTQQK